MHCSSMGIETINAVRPVEESSDLDTGDFEERPSLHLACMDGNLDLVKYFISIGEDVNAKNRWGHQPLDISIRYGHTEIAKLLKRSRAEMSHEACTDLRHRLFRSAAEGDISKVKALIEAGVSVNSCDYDERTSLHLAAANGDYDMVSFLLSSGVDVRCKDRFGRDALDDAIGGGHFKVEAALRQILSFPTDQDMKQVNGLNLDSIDGQDSVQRHKQMFSSENNFSCPGLARTSSITKMADIFHDVQIMENEMSRGQDLDFVNTDCTSNLAQYLTAKGSNVDAEIRWSSSLHAKTSDRFDVSLVAGQGARGARESSVRPADRRKRIVCEQQDDYQFMSMADEQQYSDDMISLPMGSSFRSMQLPLLDEGKEEAMLSRAGSLRSFTLQRSRSCSGLGSLCGTPSNLGLASIGSMRLSNYVAAGATVLFIDIKGFTAGCAEMSAAEVGEWVADFYERVDSAAAAHGVRKVEVRGDCCICVSGVAAALPCAEGADTAATAAVDGREDQVTRMLAFTADLHAELATLAYRGGRATSARMGVATGDVAFLVGDGGGGGRGFVSVQGDVVKLAARMEALSEAGTVLAHRSTVNKWVAEGAGRAAAGRAERAAPAMVQVECAGKGAQEAAVFDCARRAFRLPRPALPIASPPPPRACVPPALSCAAQAGRMCGARRAACDIGDASELPAKRPRSQSLS
jgi:class 3 adenylate cyclase